MKANKFFLTSTIYFQVLTHEKLEEHLKLCQKSYDLPRWWHSNKHDKALLEGVSK